MQQPANQSSQEVVDSFRSSLGPAFKVLRVNGGVIFEHNKARLFLAEVNPRELHITVPLEAEFPDHPELDGPELEERAIELLGPDLEKYKAHGYELQEIDQQPGYHPEMYDEDKIPVVVVYLGRKLDNLNELSSELSWLVAQLPSR